MRPLFLGWDHVESFEATLNLQFGPQPIGHHWSPLYGENSWNVFLMKFNFLCDWRKKDKNISDDMGVSKLSGTIHSGSELLV